eukprot:TRINITY_DN11585_c0_g1_i1.p1 TRINITY_DN11585_c0_g1~~TRINITY_DN11585_c0_g1_i1.p1  ORF type:complete len:523 (-),score=183.66 TRINITY_DN11585_c0_g1_i1:91-1659(-)
MKTHFLFILLSILPLCMGSDRNVIAKTQNGAVKGVKENNSIVWKGVPFAAPPVGMNRWRDPQPVQSWSGIRDASQYSKACAQGYGGLPPLFEPAFGISEDCLYLNVYSPLSDSSTPLPVMLFIMGGAFQFGDASCPIYRGQQLSSDTNTVVVIINYRLGPFGFLNLGGNITGNFGLKDQIQAMKWVKSNIRGFGGDPNKVTIFGESAGAMSIGIHLTSTYTQGLYQRAIMESNPLGIPYRSPQNAVEMGELFAVLVGCEFQGEDCLRKKSMADLIKAGDELPDLPDLINVNGTGISLSWMPTVDGVIVAGQPLRLFAEGKFQNIPTMIGTNADEGIMFVMLAQSGMRMVSAEYIAVVGAFFGEHAFKILEMYPPPLNPLQDCRDILSNLITDSTFACPSRLVASALSKRVNTYLYEFTFKAPSDQTVGPSYCANRVCHGEELPFIFDTYPSPTQKEIEISQQVVSFWGGFGNTGNPNQKSKLQWPLFASNTQKSMKFDYPSGVVSNLKKAQCDLFDKIGYNI